MYMIYQVKIKPFKNSISRYILVKTAPNVFRYPTDRFCLERSINECYWSKDGFFIELI